MQYWVLWYWGSGSNSEWNAEEWITRCGSSLIYEMLPGKEILYVVPITSVLGKLPVVHAGDTGTIPYRYRRGTANGSSRYFPEIARADTSPGAGDGCPMYFVNSWALGWSRDMWMNCFVPLNTTNTTYYYPHYYPHYYSLLPSLLLITTMITTWLLHDYYMITTYYYTFDSGY